MQRVIQSHDIVEMHSMLQGRRPLNRDEISAVLAH